MGICMCNSRKMEWPKWCGWSFHLENYSKHISQDDSIIEEYNKTRMDEFTDTQQIKLASFYLNHNKDEAEQANMQDAIRLVNEWKNWIGNLFHEKCPSLPNNEGHWLIIVGVGK